MEKARPSEKKKPSGIWDCGSSLYDSFERKEFQKQLHSAIAGKTLSMPHLSNRRPPPNQRRPSKISRAFRKLIQAVFSGITNKNSGYKKSKQGFYVVCDRAPKIQQVPESDRLAPEIRRTEGSLPRL